MFDNDNLSAGQYDSILMNAKKESPEIKELKLEDTQIRIQQVDESLELTALLQRIESKPLMSDAKAQQLKQQVEPSLEDTNEFAKVISQINLAMKEEKQLAPKSNLLTRSDQNA